MENKENTIVLLAEEVTIDEKRSSEIFLLITFKLFDNRANRNNEGVTAAFITEILNHREKYVALPVYADVPALLDRDYANLGHRYNAKTGSFGTNQIGGLVDFTTAIGADGVVSLYAEARIPKRESEICERLEEMYVRGGLSVSFEVRYNPANVIEIDGARFVNAGDGNTLTGIAIVSVPACPDAVALDMVAETIEANEVKEEVQDNEEVKVSEAEVATAEVTEAEAEVTTAETAEAEVIHEERKVEEGFDTCPETGEKVHFVHVEETVVETVEEEPAEPQPVVAEQDPRDMEICALKEELCSVKAELQRYKEAEAAAELKERQCGAQAFASEQGLDLEDAAVAQAIAEVNYEALAKLCMANKPEEKEDTVKVAAAAFVGFALSGGEYGGLLERAAK